MGCPEGPGDELSKTRRRLFLQRAKGVAILAFAVVYDAVLLLFLQALLAAKVEAWWIRVLSGSLGAVSAALLAISLSVCLFGVCASRRGAPGLRVPSSDESDFSAAELEIQVTKELRETVRRRLELATSLWLWAHTPLLVAMISAVITVI